MENPQYRFIYDFLGQEEAFQRADDSDDTLFYQKTRMVNHIDNFAEQTIRNLNKRLIQNTGTKILDLMAGFDSHLHEAVDRDFVAGIGLNEEELKANKDLDEYKIHDLNKDPSIPYEDEIFDIVLITLSVQYLTKPILVMKEAARVLKPGGLLIIYFSNRFFPQKVLNIWQALPDKDKLLLVKFYISQVEEFEDACDFVSLGHKRPDDDKYSHMGIPSDPVYAVFAEKKTEEIVQRELNLADLQEVQIDEERVLANKKVTAESNLCPYCEERLHTWAVTDNPMTTWDHDLKICVSDECPYLIRGWRTMYEQGINALSYRLAFDPKGKGFNPIPIYNLSLIKNELRD